MRRSMKRGLTIAACTLAGALAGGLAVFSVLPHFPLAKAEKPATVPAPSFVAEAPTSALARLDVAAVPEGEGPEREAETAGNPVQSASEGTLPEMEPEEGSAVAGAPEEKAAGKADGGGGQDRLLEMVSGEARLVTRHLATENARLREELEIRDKRLRKLSEALAAAQARLDSRESERAAAESAVSGRSRDAAVSAWVMDVNPDLGMVVLSQGARQGVRYGLPLVVTRDRRKVASVRVVDVRENISGAVVVETARKEYPRTGDRAALMRAAGP